MSEPRKCDVCGEWDDGHDNHECPGTPEEQRTITEDRIDDLERRISFIEGFLVI